MLNVNQIEEQNCTKCKKIVEIVDVKCKIKFRRDHVATKWDEGCLVNVNIG